MTNDDKIDTLENLERTEQQSTAFIGKKSSPPMI